MSELQFLVLCIGNTFLTEVLKPVLLARQEEKTVDGLASSNNVRNAQKSKHYYDEL